MVLFKAYRGTASELPAMHNAGYVYFTTDEGNLYVDVTSDEGLKKGKRVRVNGGTADKLLTARTIQTNLESGDAVNFDGSANVTPGVTGILPVTHGGTGVSVFEGHRILVGHETSGIGSIAYASGALYATASDEDPKFGVLPINCGGTNATDSSTALSNLGGFPKTGGTITGEVNIKYPLEQTRGIGVIIPDQQGKLILGLASDGHSIAGTPDELCLTSKNELNINAHTIRVRYVDESGTYQGSRIVFSPKEFPANNFISVNKDQSGRLILHANDALEFESGPLSQTSTHPLPVKWGGTGATSASAALTNLGGLPTTGGTLTGALSIQDLILDAPSSIGGRYIYFKVDGAGKHSISYNDEFLTISTPELRFTSPSGAVQSSYPLPVAWGGTGQSSLKTNSVLVGNGLNGLNQIASVKGALYSTGTNAEPKFGTLPINCGGTGATSASAACTNLGALPIIGGTITGTLSFKKIDSTSPLCFMVNDQLKHIINYDADTFTIFCSSKLNFQPMSEAVESDKPLPIAWGGTGNTTGNAKTATKLATAKTISLTGAITGSTTFDGGSNKTITTTLADSGVTAGTYGPVAQLNNGTVWVSSNTGVDYGSAVCNWEAKQNCQVSFDWLVSAESADKLTITAAGTNIVDKQGGSNPPAQGSETVQLHTGEVLIFSFLKDVNINSYQDQVRIYNVKYGKDLSTTPTIPIKGENISRYFIVTQGSDYGFYPGIPVSNHTVDAKGRITKDEVVYAPIAVPSYNKLSTTGGTISGNLTVNGELTVANNVIRLGVQSAVSPSNNNLGCKVNFGNGDYVYLHEAADDTLTIHAKTKLNFTASSLTASTNPLPIAWGGTGATTAAAARTNLGITDSGGTATSAGSLTTTASFRVNLSSTSSASFNGTQTTVTPGVQGTLPISYGGTGSTSASGARSALSVYSKSEVDNKVGTTGVTAGTYGALENLNKLNAIWVSNNSNIQSSTATTTWTAKSNCNISLDWAVSSESSSYDFLTITINGTAKVSGKGGTTLQTGSVSSTSVAKGASIIFKYQKDGSTNKGMDRAEIYNVKYGSGSATPSTLITIGNLEDYFTVTHGDYGFYPGIPIPNIIVDSYGRITSAETIYVGRKGRRGGSSSGGGGSTEFDPTTLPGTTSDTTIRDGDWWAQLKTWVVNTSTSSQRSQMVGKVFYVRLSSSVLGTTTHFVRCIGYDCDGSKTLTFQTMNCLATTGSFDDNTAIWEDAGASGAIVSDVRYYCSTYYNYFPGKSSIKPVVKLTCTTYNGNTDNSNIAAFSKTTENCFILSGNEYGFTTNVTTQLDFAEANTSKTPYQYFNSSSKRTKYLGTNNDPEGKTGLQTHWTRTRGTSAIKNLCIVSSSGSSSQKTCSEYIGVAPAFVIG